MTAAEISRRLAALEREVARLKAVATHQGGKRVPWWKHVAGSFAGDKAFRQAMKLGRAYRLAQRPKAKRRSRP